MIQAQDETHSGTRPSSAAASQNCAITMTRKK